MVLIKSALLAGTSIANIVDPTAFARALFAVVEDVAPNRRSRRGKPSRGADSKYSSMLFKNVAGGASSLTTAFSTAAHASHVS